MIEIERIRIDGRLLQKTDRYRITENKRPVISWSVVSDGNDRIQESYRTELICEGEKIWDTGEVAERSQRVVIDAPLAAEKKIIIRLTVTDNCGQTAVKEDYFFVSALEQYEKHWITQRRRSYEGALYFRRDFTVKNSIKAATLYISGIGCQSVSLNGCRPDTAILDPAVSDYTKTVYFVMYPDIKEYLRQGENSICAVVGNGWRNNPGAYLNGLGERKVEFFGKPQLCAILRLEYEDGSQEIISTDKNWLVGSGAITENSLFDGETYDAARAVIGWNVPETIPEGFTAADAEIAPGGVARTSVVEPVIEQEVYKPRVVRRIQPDITIYDFGQNIAGVCRIKLPQKMRAGERIELHYAEDYDNNGQLHFANLRNAACRDVFIASGDERDPEYWQPEFTYHGFRYVQVNGKSCPEILAVSIYNDIDSRSFFNCGSPVANAVQRAVVQTERANLHNLMTDCPQRDERMGWMNDATVRFEETPYNFETAGIFEKVLNDIVDSQSPDGAITCTAPYIYGARPADPVCSSFLVAGLEEILFSGNTELVSKYFEKFEAWQQYLTDRAEDNLVYYSYYGDWAAPVYACEGGENNINAVKSNVAPGEFISSCCYYYNAILLVRMAEMLGLPKKKKYYETQADTIRKAILNKWWNEEKSTICTGSDACQSIALFLDLIPQENRKKAAKHVADELTANDLRFTTGNICTRYMMDALFSNGYDDIAWDLLTNEKYPSIGYMLQNDATTVWERFELKRLPDMNSYNHPMYGAMAQSFYAYIAGIMPLSIGAEKILIKPHLPKKLLFAEANVDTAHGCIWAKWFKRFDKVCLHLSIPFGTTATIEFLGETKEVGSGEWRFEFDNS